MTPHAPSALRDAAARLIGPAPDRLAPPCMHCGARPGATCRWRRAPGPPLTHSVRHDRWSGWSAAHGRLVAAVAAWAEATVEGRPSRSLELDARARHRALCRRAESAGAVAPLLPELETVLVAAGVVPR